MAKERGRRGELAAVAGTAHELAEALDALLGEADANQRVQLKRTAVRIGTLRLLSMKLLERTELLAEGCDDDD